MISLDRIMKVENLNLLENYTEVETHSQGVAEAERFFKDCEIEGTVSINFLKKFQIRGERDYDIKVYECYVDSGSVDYFHFSYKIDV